MSLTLFREQLNDAGWRFSLNFTSFLLETVHVQTKSYPNGLVSKAAITITLLSQRKEVSAGLEMHEWTLHKQI